MSKTEQPVAASSNDGLCVTASTLAPVEFQNCMTVAELKALIRDWPETNEDGEPCEVWLCNRAGLSNQARTATPLNVRRSEDGSKVWADLMLGHDA